MSNILGRTDSTPNDVFRLKDNKIRLLVAKFQNKWDPTVKIYSLGVKRITRHLNVEP